MRVEIEINRFLSTPPFCEIQPSSIRKLIHPLLNMLKNIKRINTIPYTILFWVSHNYRNQRQFFSQLITSVFYKQLVNIPKAMICFKQQREIYLNFNVLFHFL